MRIQRFNTLRDYLSGESFVKGGQLDEVYRRWRGRWFDGESIEVSDKTLQARLTSTLEESKSWRPKKSKITYFPILELDAVAAIQFKSPIRKETRQAVESEIVRRVQTSGDRYNADHDGLTALLNKRAFEDCLRDIDERFRQSGLGQGGGETVGAAEHVALLAVDLDRFKQINDAYGHLYGDVVLQCLARRLTNFAREEEKRLDGEVSIEVGRLGGEEFGLALVGEIDHSAISQIAERVRVAIGGQILPTDDEFNELADPPVTKEQLPPDSERRVTMSIGVAARAIADTEDDLIRALLEEADKAVYRAKASGRNRVVWFDDIVIKHGSVLERHSGNGLIAIDIGRDVNVQLGQEFLVYHPDFAGGVPYMFSDGRSERRLGDYPKLPSGRIVVIDVQSEISFCRVTAAQASLPVHFDYPRGSRLEAIPVGSITHLLDSDLIGPTSSDLLTADKFREVLIGSADDGQRRVILLVRIADASRVAEASGSAFVNRALFSLYRFLNETFRSSPKTQVQSDGFAILLQISGSASDAGVKLSEIGETVIQANPAGVDLSLGGFIEGWEEWVSPSSSPLKVEFGLEMARYAAEVREADEIVVVFSTATAITLASQARRAGEPLKAMLDLDQFENFGVRGPKLMNQKALTHFSLREADKARDVWRRAFQESPDDPMIAANLGLAEFTLGDPREAYKYFRSSLDSTDWKVPNEMYAIRYVVAAAEAKEAGDQVEAQRFIELAGEFLSSETLTDASREALEDAVERLAQEKVS
ncbi:MAG: diguanylate cyclase [Acidobacteria bacterium]|nr:diguanylate cyclase [Acidobacteriota bacterium]